MQHVIIFTIVYLFRKYCTESTIEMDLATA